MSADMQIREGFLCPICMQDLGTVSQLTEHFEQVHANEDKAVLNQLKGLFGKAKRKLLGQDREEDVFNPFSSEQALPEGAQSLVPSLSATGIDPTLWEPQDLGATRSLTNSFKKVRDARIDRFVVETNKLLIRLDKLISLDAPSDPSKRKAYEKTVVPWAPDADFNLCLACGKQFTLTRRRHHCRMCGGIICNKCSQFLPIDYAKKLTNPAFRYDGEGFRRSSSNSSLNSILSPEGDFHIRTCHECRRLLERRDQQMEQRNFKPFLFQLYEKMKNYMNEAEQILPEFLQISESLNSGETRYTLQEAQTKRIKVMKLYEAIDSLSKRIGTLNVSSADPPPPPTALRLQRMIRAYASNFLTENLMGLQSLPTEEELVKLQEANRLEAQRRAEAERRAAAERERKKREEQKIEELRAKRPSPTTPTDSKKESVSAPGWKPAEVNSKADDPMIQQINIIRGYVKQARQAHRWDEVQMLEDNLKDLQAEYWRQQQQNSSGS